MSNLTIIEKSANEVINMLPKSEIDERTQRDLFFALTQCLKNESLAKCTKSSIADAIAQGLGSGLSFNPTLHHLYLVPFKGVATLQVGYKGLQMLAAPDLIIIHSDVVRTTDTFTALDKEGFPYLHRKPLPKPDENFTPGDVYAAYAIGKYHGNEVYRLLNSYELNEAVKRSASFDRQTGKPRTGSAWANWRDAMCMKTAIRALIARYPISNKLAQFIANEEQMEIEIDSNSYESVSNVETIVLEANDDLETQVRQRFKHWLDNEASEDDKKDAAEWRASVDRKRTTEEAIMFLNSKGIEL